MNKEEFGSFLQHLRKINTLSIRQLAEHSKVSRSYIANIEAGKRDIPSADILRKLATPLKIDYLTLLEKAGYYKNDDPIQTEVLAQSKENTKIPEDPLGIQRDLNYILFQDDINLNLHPLTAEDRQKIRNMLDAMFPEKSKNPLFDSYWASDDVENKEQVLPHKTLSSTKEVEEHIQNLTEHYLKFNQQKNTER